MDFARGIRLSFICHFLLILVMIIKVNFFSKPELDLSQAIRFDMVGLPEKYTQADILNSEVNEQVRPKDLPEKEIPQQSLEANKSTVKEAKNKNSETKSVKLDNESINLKSTQKKQKDALAKLKKLSAIEKIRQSVELEKSQNSKQTQITARPIKGRVLSKGTALTGLDKIQSDSYLVQLDTKIKNHWQLPQWLVGKPLKTKVLVKFNPDGSLVSKNIFQSSGHPTYDEYCLRAIEKSLPFPSVPDKFTEVYKEDGVLIGFPE